jgi:DDE family transposase
VTEGDSTRPKERRDSGQSDLFRARLDQIVDLGHPLAKLGRAGSSSPTPRRCRDPLDGHTLATVIPDIETQIGASLTRIVADRGYRGHNVPPDHKFKVYISGQRRRVTETIKRDLRRRSAVEPVLGHAKADHRMGRNHLAGQAGDAANAVLAAAGYNFRRLLEWLALLLSVILAARGPHTDNDPSAAEAFNQQSASPRRRRILHGRLSRVTRDDRGPTCSRSTSAPRAPAERNTRRP